ncbi:uncharacterized protein LOC118648666 isoform X1 [Monomorium pharaonis]|uniref:uncharacterized protein LOC118648666 isoform X1 n=1 Tax=Monomorium pharaonis TaxID=307658 RepID=UPI0017474CAF|nr:uncharacterized protein LOC118648666 isoform X1 [Monomorium pharaonis]
MCLVLFPCFGHDVKLRDIYIYIYIQFVLVFYVKHAAAKIAKIRRGPKAHEEQMFDLFSFVVTESDFLQHSEPSFMETTTIEVDPVTQESITTTTRTETRTISSTGAGGTDDLRESMQKIMDTFMTEEKKDH